MGEMIAVLMEPGKSEPAKLCCVHSQGNSEDAWMHCTVMAKPGAGTLSNRIEANSLCRNTQNTLPEFSWFKCLKLVEWKP